MKANNRRRMNIQQEIKKVVIAKTWENEDYVPVKLKVEHPPAGQPPRHLNFWILACLNSLPSGQKINSNAPPIRTEISLLKGKFRLQSNTVHAFQREICRNDTFKLLWPLLMNNSTKYKGKNCNTILKLTFRLVEGRKIFINFKNLFEKRLYWKHCVSFVSLILEHPIKSKLITVKTHASTVNVTSWCR